MRRVGAVLETSGRDGRHGTHVPTYLVTPRRGRVLAAELLCASVVGTLVAVLSVLVAVVIGLPWSAGQGVDLGAVVGDPLFWTRLLAATVGIVLMAVFGVSVAALVRSTVAAVFVLVGLFVIEGIVELQVPGDLFDRLFFNSLFTFMSPPDPSLPIGDLPSWVGGPIVVGWIAVVAVAATVRTLRGDVRRTAGPPRAWAPRSSSPLSAPRAAVELAARSTAPGRSPGATAVICSAPPWPYRRTTGLPGRRRSRSRWCAGRRTTPVVASDRWWSTRAGRAARGSSSSATARIGTSMRRPAPGST